MESTRQIFDDAALEGLRQKANAHDAGVCFTPEDQTRLDAQQVVQAARQQIERQELEKIHAEINELRRSLRALDERMRRIDQIFDAFVERELQRRLAHAQQRRLRIF